jgi:hypothetical protein
MEGRAVRVLTCSEYDVAGNERAMFLPTSVEIRNSIEIWSCSDGPGWQK